MFTAGPFHILHTQLYSKLVLVEEIFRYCKLACSLGCIAVCCGIYHDVVFITFFTHTSTGICDLYVRDVGLIVAIISFI